MNRCPYTGEPYCIYGKGPCPDWGACGVDKTKEEYDEDDGDEEDGV